MTETFYISSNKVSGEFTVENDIIVSGCWIFNVFIGQKKEVLINWMNKKFEQVVIKKKPIGDS